jgi:hypothetical protein
MLASVGRLANHWIGLLPESDITGVARTIIAITETIIKNTIFFMLSLLKVVNMLIFYLLIEC